MSNIRTTFTTLATPTRRWRQVQSHDESWQLEELDDGEWYEVAYVWQWSTASDHPWRSQIAGMGPTTNEDHETLEGAMLRGEVDTKKRPLRLW